MDKEIITWCVSEKNSQFNNIPKKAKFISRAWLLKSPKRTDSWPHVRYCQLKAMLHKSNSPRALVIYKTQEVRHYWSTQPWRCTGLQGYFYREAYPAIVSWVSRSAALYRFDRGWVIGFYCSMRHGTLVSYNPIYSVYLEICTEWLSDNC